MSLQGSCNVAHRSMFCRDNLDILRGINSGCIDLIYLDPPFNKKKQFTASIGSSAEGASFSDVFREEDVKEEWVQTIKEDNEELREFLLGIKYWGTSYNFAYLAYMSIRVLEMRRILKDTGSIYLHCDPTMSHYLKLLLDCVFGEKNFRNEITWWYGGGGASKSQWARKHDVIFFYSKGKEWIFNTDEVREAYKWNKGQKRADGSERDYEKGKIPDDVFNINGIMPWAKESTGYPTQKPLKLLDRIIKASSNEGDIVLDPFCGCATACIAAEGLKRKWIGIDVSIKAYELVQTRLKEELEERYGQMYVPDVCFSTDPPRRTDDGATEVEQKYVYVISNTSYPGEYKVGIAKDWKARLNSYQTSDPNRAYKLEYKLYTPHFRAIERHIHETFDSKHEWVRGDLQRIREEILLRDQQLSG